MKIAVCLFGQPRNYKKGHEVLSQFFKKQDVVPDFFYHAWTLEPGRIYPSSPHRNIKLSSLTYNQNTITELNELYKPVAHYHEPQKTEFNPERFATTLAYKNTVNSKKKENMNNVLSQMYSRTIVRDLLNNHILKNKTSYNKVIMTRFDYSATLDFNLHDLDPSYTYVAGKNYPQRCILPDTFIIAPQSVFLEWFTLYTSLEDVLNYKELYTEMKKYGELLEINPEEIIMAHYLYHNVTLDLVKYVPFIKTGL
jgi:hypothetical protein